MASGTRSKYEAYACKHPADDFCNVCARYLGGKSGLRKFSLENLPTVHKSYEAYFKMAVSDQDKPWVPHVICAECRRNLEGWYNGEQRKMKFAVPRVWRKTLDHEDGCLFCAKLPSGSRSVGINMANFDSSSAPVLHGPEYPVPERPPLEQPSPTALPLSQGSAGTSGSSSAQSSQGLSDEFEPSSSTAMPRNPYYPNQEDVDDLIRDLCLTKCGEVLLSRLKQWDLLEENVKITSQRNRDLVYEPYFTYCDGLCYCSNIRGLFEEIGIECNPEEWRLFIDGSTKSLKAVLLHNGNIYPSLPMAHSIELKETYDNVCLLLECLEYDTFQWEVIGDFKMVAFLMGLQGGYTSHPCFLCLWNSRADERHYIQKEWPERSEFTIGVNNVKWEPLIDPKKVLMPPLHIKLGLMKQFSKALDQSSSAFEHLKACFPKLSEAKIKAGVFVGPDIRKLMKDEEFLTKLNEKETRAWNSFVNVCTGFLGNDCADDYKDRLT